MRFPFGPCNGTMRAMSRRDRECLLEEP